MKRVAGKLADIEDIWKVHLSKIREMRATTTAPVDTMGCHMLADPLAAPKRLIKHGCSIESMLAVSTDDLEKLLVPVSFYKRKAVYIQKTAAILRDKFEGDVPASVEELCSLPGVGPKMAHLVMQVAWDRVEGIAVDTHVHRITNRLGWVKTRTPEETRHALEALLPRTEWATVNKILVGFGQSICLPVRPLCSSCSLNDICPSAVITKTVAKKAKKSVKMDDEDEKEEKEEEETVQEKKEEEMMSVTEKKTSTRTRSQRKAVNA